MEEKIRIRSTGLVSALRNAMSDTVPLAPLDQIKAILAYVPAVFSSRYPSSSTHHVATAKISE